jgi:hypothetical protein
MKRFTWPGFLAILGISITITAMIYAIASGLWFMTHIPPLPHVGAIGGYHWP